MTNEELKKKIESIIRNAKRDFAYCVPEEWAVKVLADALIAAGIGDVKDVEAEANRYEMLYLLQNRDMALAERRAHDAEHRAEVAEKTLSKVFTKTFPWCCAKVREDIVDECLQEAEKELAEEDK